MILHWQHGVKTKRVCDTTRDNSVDKDNSKLIMTEVICGTCGDMLYYKAKGDTVQQVSSIQAQVLSGTIPAFM